MGKTSELTESIILKKIKLLNHKEKAVKRREKD